jgi:hypothetical protein
MSTQSPSPPSRTLTGSKEITARNGPSGVAVTNVFSVVNEPTAVGSPDFAAKAIACATDPAAKPSLDDVDRA